MLSQDLGVMILLGQFCLSKKSMNLFVADAMKILGAFASLRFVDQVMSALL